jgi:hypothetical protein
VPLAVLVAAGCTALLKIPSRSTISSKLEEKKQKFYPNLFSSDKTSRGDFLLFFSSNPHT